MADSFGGRNLVNPIKQNMGGGGGVRTRQFHPRDGYGRSARYTWAPGQ